jgi:hypothetical protein
MKKLTYLFSFILLSAFLSSCSNKGMKVVTREDGGTEVSNYDSFAWVANVDNIPNVYAFYGPGGTLVFNNNSARKMIKEAVELQMKARGFTNDNSNPDMLVNFSVLEGPTELRTYVMNNGQDYLGLGPRSEAVRMVPVDEGTVLINFIDAKTGTQIWQGFASGALNEEDIKSMGKVETKVGAIFEDFDFNQFNTAER